MIQLVQGQRWVCRRAGAGGIIYSSLEVIKEIIVVVAVFFLQGITVLRQIIPDLGSRFTGQMASIATEQGINLARQVFGIFVGNELSSFDPEPSIFVVKAAARIACSDGFCGTACAVQR